jgi:hypothetical protein
VHRALLLGALLALGLPACRDRRPPPLKPVAARAAAPAPLQIGWDPRTGKGDVRQHLASGDVLRVCFHCGFAGYTGGLVIGNFNGSGYGLYPKRPIRGFRMINVFCAQDESIWDHAEQAEYTYGWSENYGKGDDGKPLKYVRGRIVDSGPRTVVLQSENAGGCYRVTKVATTRAEVRWWIIATRITNTCDRPVRFDFFSGDDPWLGLYSSAEGDVGWTPDGLVRHERAYGAGQFVAGGLYDLGEAGSTTGFSNQANFFLLDPATPLPDLALFANSFAHSRREIDPTRALDDKKMRALNIGWTARTLAPGQGLTVAMALGLAETGAPGSIPRLPAIDAADWSVWRRHLKEDNSPASDAVQFAAELVELELDERQLTVVGSYHLRNPDASSQSLSIRYPFLVGDDRPAPATVLVDGKELPVRRDARSAEVVFPVHVPPHGLARFVVRYTQRHSERRAGYMVTSALRWPRPIDRAVFVVRHPARMPVTISYPTQHRERRGDTVVRWIVAQPFVPEREVELSW